MNIFKKIAAGLEWFGKEIGKGIKFLPKVITLADDVEGDAVQVLPQTIAVVEDAAALAAASAKDSGVFITDIAALGVAVGVAIASKALNIAADAGVVAAVEKFASDFNEANVQDVLTAWDKLAADTKTLDATLLQDLQKLEADA